MTRVPYVPYQGFVILTTHRRSIHLMGVVWVLCMQRPRSKASGISCCGHVLGASYICVRIPLPSSATSSPQSNPAGQQPLNADAIILAGGCMTFVITMRLPTCAGFATLPRCVKARMDGWPMAKASTSHHCAAPSLHIKFRAPPPAPCSILLPESNLTFSSIRLSYSAHSTQ